MDPSLRRFALLLAGGVSLLILAPLALAYARAGGGYLPGYPYNTDDHMVYAAWMRQAAEGRLLFENRFTTDLQPGLTLNGFFLVLGWLSVPLGPLGATVLAQIAATFAVVLLSADLARRLYRDPAVQRLALVLAVFGAGLGFLVFRDYGVALDPRDPSPLGDLLLRSLPADVWQPEAFVFPSLLTSALFGWALALILVALRSAALARTEPKAAIPGAIAMLLLANTHSYDALLVGLVLVAVLAGALATRTLTRAWTLRGLAIVAGIVPPALWLAYVLKADPVFAARAATPTFTEGPRSLVAGILPLALLALFGLAEERSKRALAGIALYAALLVGLCLADPGGVGARYPVAAPLFVLAFVAAAAAAALVARGEPVRDALVAWAFVGLVAPYFPALFERKLAMGLSLPWALLAAGGVAALLRAVPAPSRRIAAALPLLLLCATSARWFARLVASVSANVANTTVHPVVFPREVGDMVAVLRPLGRAAVVLAPPGVPNRPRGEDGEPLLDRYDPPLLPDLNPILVGMAGSRAYAGHWSETPDYNARRGEASRAYFRDGGRGLSAFARAHGITHLVVPTEGVAKTGLGERIAGGPSFELYRLR